MFVEIILKLTFAKKIIIESYIHIPDNNTF